MSDPTDSASVPDAQADPPRRPPTWARMSAAFYRIMRWLVANILIGGLLVGVVLFGALYDLLTTGNLKISSPLQWPSVHWLLTHPLLSAGVGIAILVLYGLSELAHRASRTVIAPSRVAPSRRPRQLPSWLRNLPHHRIGVVVRALDGFYRITRWVVNNLVISGILLGAVIAWITTGSAGSVDPRTWAIYLLVTEHVWQSALVIAVALVLLAAGAIANQVSQISSGLGFNSLKQFRVACAAAVDTTINSIPKYDASLYVKREGVDQEFAQFLRSQSSTLLVLGAAGMGKTNLLCEMARTRAGELPTLLLRGSTHMDGKWGLWRAVAEAVGVGKLSEVDLSQFLVNLDASLQIWQAQLVIFIDGVNENTQIDQLRVSLANAAQMARGSAIHICMSCRDVDWHFFSSETALVTELYTPEEASADASHGVAVGLFTDSEYDQAWEKYRQRYHVQGDLSEALKQVCHHPLMLSFLCLAFASKQVPPGIHRREIFAEYWQDKLRARYGPLTEAKLLDLVGMMYQRRVGQVRELDAVAVINNNAEYNHLLDESVIIYTHKNRVGEQLVEFTYDAFFEYALSTYLIGSAWGWASDDSHDPASNVLAHLQEMQAEARKYRFAQGCLQYLLLYLMDSHRTDSQAPRDRTAAQGFLLALTKMDQRWKVFFCDFVTKIDSSALSDELIPALVDIATDGDSFVRWSAGAALGALVGAQGVTLASDQLRKLEVSREWQQRETAAVALGQLYRDFAPLERRLEHLADDINWRVRRQVGNTLGDLCRLAPDNANGLLRAWSKARKDEEGKDLWRLRRAVVQARTGLLRDPELALELLPGLAHDDVEEIRWRTVSDLANLMKATLAPTVYERTLPLLLDLSRDEHSVWTRQHVAFWLPDLYHLVGLGCSEIAEALLSDRADEVRWEVARSLGAFKDTSQAKEWLARFNQETDPRVKFAVRYSLAAIDPDSDSGKGSTGGEREELQAETEQLARSSRTPEKPFGSDILDLAKTDRYENIKQKLASATEEFSPEQYRNFFEMLRKDEDVGMRWAAAGRAADVLALTEVYDDPERNTIISEFTHDWHYWTRREGLASLGKMLRSGFRPSTSLVERVIACAADPEPEVRWEALLCLQEFRRRGTELAPAYPLDAIDGAISERMSDPDRQIRELVQAALVPDAPDVSV
ncbi:MAG TPA: hypothetical protein VMV29_20525 [Ktedonobacterales bacterium]|nr:hypothetical protein [Ktedonobacterales bacterium]